MEGGRGRSGADVVNGEGAKHSGNLPLGLSLEAYMDFCDDIFCRRDFVLPELNHIILMHGFSRMYRRPKAEILRALDAMELMQAPRSTLREGTSCGAPLTLEEVRRDVQAIGWQLCPLMSVQLVGLPNGEDAAAASSASAFTIAFPVSCISACPGGERKKEKRKKNKETANTDRLTTSSGSRNKKRNQKVSLEGPLPLPAVVTPDEVRALH